MYRDVGVCVSSEIESSFQINWSHFVIVTFCNRDSSRSVKEESAEKR